MKRLTKVIYRKYLEDARQARMEMGMPPHHCIHTGLDFDARTRSEGFWTRMNAIQRLRTDSRASSPT